MSVQALLKEAIESRKNVRLVYDGFARDCSPHLLGWKGGKLHCLVYQFGGTTSEGPIPPDSKDNWRCLIVSKIRNLQLIEGEWHTFENRVNPSGCIDIPVAQVQPVAERLNGLPNEGH